MIQHVNLNIDFRCSELNKSQILKTVRLKKIESLMSKITPSRSQVKIQSFIQRCHLLPNVEEQQGSRHQVKLSLGVIGQLVHDFIHGLEGSHQQGNSVQIYYHTEVLFVGYFFSWGGGVNEREGLYVLMIHPKKFGYVYIREWLSYKKR